MKKELTEKQKKLIAVSGVLIFIVLSAVIFVYAGRPMIRFLSEPEKFRAWVDDKGILGRLAFMGMAILQVFVAVIPGEPIEIAAGYAFGALEGTILCMISMTVGSMLVFWFVRKFGMKAVEVFFPREKIYSLKFLQNKKRMTFWIAIIFFIPGTPKDLLCYFVGLTDIKTMHWLLISAIARIPSIVTSTIGGDALGLRNYKAAVIAFSVAIAVCGAGLLIYRAITRKKHDQAEKDAETDEKAFESRKSA